MKRYRKQTFLVVAVAVGLAIAFYSSGAMRGGTPEAQATPSSATTTAAPDKMDMQGRIVDVTGRTVILNAAGLQQEFHVLPDAKVTKDSRITTLNAVLPGDMAKITYVDPQDGPADEMQVAVTVEAWSRQ